MKGKTSNDKKYEDAWQIIDLEDNCTPPTVIDLTDSSSISPLLFTKATSTTTIVSDKLINGLGFTKSKNKIKVLPSPIKRKATSAASIFPGGDGSDSTIRKKRRILCMEPQNSPKVSPCLLAPGTKIEENPISLAREYYIYDERKETTTTDNYADMRKTYSSPDLTFMSAPTVVDAFSLHSSSKDCSSSTAPVSPCRSSVHGSPFFHAPRVCRISNASLTPTRVKFSRQTKRHDGNPYADTLETKFSTMNRKKLRKVSESVKTCLSQLKL